MEDKTQMYEGQKDLIEIARDILREHMPKYSTKYNKLFYGKKIPPHIDQLLQAQKTKIIMKPIYNKIRTELGIGQRSAVNLVNEIGVNGVLNNLDKLKGKKLTRVQLIRLGLKL